MNSLKSIIDSRLEFVEHFDDRSYCVCRRCGTKWKTRTVDGEEEYDLNAVCGCGSKEYTIKPLLDNNDFVIQVLQELVKAYQTEIHEYLVPSKLPNKEDLIRGHVRLIMKKIKPIVDERIASMHAQYSFFEKQAKKYPNDEETQQRMREIDGYYMKYAAIKEDVTALIAFRHFKTFVLYIDRLFDNNIFTPALHLFEGFYFYANSMALNGDVKFIEKQCFAGAGKSVTDCALISFLFGIDINNDILKIFGNKDNVSSTMDTILTIMCSKEYAKVFPYYAKFNGEKENIFSVCKPANGEFKISGSVKSVNLRVRAKGEKIDGVRAKYIFLDDITAADDAEKIERHKQDIFLYQARWSKRRYDNNNFYVIVSGTTYHQEDILSYLKHIFGVVNAKPTPFRFTSISTSDEIMPNGKSVFCVIYGLDKNDRSTFEQKFPTQQFLLEREKNLRNFMAMVQQEPQPPLGAPFDYENLPNLYGTEGIPHLEDRTQEVCRASLDPARKGKDFHSMPVIVSINGVNFLQDCIYEQSPPEQLPMKVVDMIERHHIVHLDIEENTDTTFDVLIRRILRERGIEYCKVTKFFSWKKKEEKIRDCETAIKSIYYPDRGVYSPNSPMGKFMYWLTGYNYEAPPKHDDSVDSLANYAQTFILNKVTASVVRSFRR